MAPHEEPREDGHEPPPVRAAQYVRMSTDHQQYSTENQAETIREYAARHGLLIVRSYADEGKSGLRLEGRDQLQRMIADVESGGADFQVVRWSTTSAAGAAELCELDPLAGRYAP
jgi:resolvase-like protein